MSDPGTKSDATSSIAAYIQALAEGPEEPLRQLADRTDPESVRRKLGILLNAGRKGEAAELVKSCPLDGYWSDLAVRALAQIGDAVGAKRAIEWARAHADRSTATRAVVFFAQEELRSVVSRGGEAAVAVPGDLTADELARLSDIATVLDPTVAAIGLRVENELESQVIQTALRVQDLLGNREQAEKLAVVLATRQPIPIFLAHLALQKRISPPDKLAERLRSEHTASFEAALLSTLVRGNLEGRTREAYAEARQLAFRASSDAEQEQVASVIADLAQHLADPATRDEAEDLAESLLKDERFLKLLRADRLLRQGAVSEASAILEETRDESNPLWLQLFAKLQLQEGAGGVAAECLLKAAAMCPDPDLLKTAASVAFEQQRLDICLDALTRLIAINPTEALAYRHIATLHADRGEFLAAAQQFKKLSQVVRLEDADRFNWSLCLAKAGDLSAALAVLGGYSDPDNLPMGACILRAECLAALGQIESAFQSLTPQKARFWEHADYVRECLNLAFMSGNEEEGHEALVQLQILQAANPTDAILQQFPLDTLVADMRQRRDHWNDLHGEILRGKCGWLLADFAFGNAAYWGWRMRTQELRWVGDEPLSRAQFSVYSTNAFRLKTDRENPRLEEIEVPESGATAVVDLSALITLHRLGHLASAAAYFGKLLVPSAYLENLLNDARKLLPHQSSRLEAVRQIKDAVDRHQISVTGATEHRLVSEYDERNDATYRIRDVLDVLHTAGRITEAQYEQALRAAHKPPHGGNGLDLLQGGGVLVVQLLTLQTLVQFGILSAMLDEFRIALTSTDATELEGEVRAFQVQEEVWRWHNDLWGIIRSNPHFVQTVATVPPDMNNRLAAVPVPLAATLLARETGACLLADDRLYQAVVLNDRGGEPYPAFGSDKVLIALFRSQAITADQLANSFLHLLSWRYRFIIVPSEVLRVLANRFCMHPPGTALRQVAHYIHDCMRDPGLLSGKEPSDPPMSIAEKLFMQWTAEIAEFLVDMWSEPAWEEARLEALTEWVVREMFPSAPRNTQLPGGRSVADVSTRLIVSRVLIRASELPDVTHANKIVRTVARLLGVSEREYFSILSGAIDEP